MRVESSFNALNDPSKAFDGGPKPESIENNPLLIQNDKEETDFNVILAKRLEAQEKEYRELHKKVVVPYVQREKKDNQNQLPSFHIVQQGQTLIAIARLYNVSLNEIRNLNNLTDPNYIVIGQKLALRPDALTSDNKSVNKNASVQKIHLVRAGETLYSISRKYQTTVVDLKALNNIGSDNQIIAGQNLIVTNSEQNQREMMRGSSDVKVLSMLSFSRRLNRSQMIYKLSRITKVKITGHVPRLGRGLKKGGMPEKELKKIIKK